MQTQKDIIYVDVDDDITTIIGKVKDTQKKIVAIVPPARVGVLQSAVNLRLLKRAATTGGKQIVLISNNKALVALAAVAKIPVAKNLQSKPELAQVSALDVDDGNDVIDGSELPANDLPKPAKKADKKPTPVTGIDIEDKNSKRSGAAGGKKLKVPSFRSFRKKMFILGGLLAALIIFMIWAIWFAPRATVVVKARTAPLSISNTVTLGSDLKTDAAKASIKTDSNKVDKTLSANFDATGKKEVGEKASGFVTFKNCEDTKSVTVAAGSFISAGGKNYIIDSTVVVPGGKGSFITGCIEPGVSEPVSVRAAEIGEDYNTGQGKEFTVEGFTGQMKAVTEDGMGGGSKKEIKIVTQADIDKARDEALSENTDAIKKDLEKEFGDNTSVIKESFSINKGKESFSPAVGQELKSGQGKFSVKVSYSMIGILKEEIDDYLSDVFEAKIKESKNQRVYSNGADDVQIVNFTAKPKNTVVIRSTGAVGPFIKDEDIKNQVKGKRYGEIQSELKNINGVSDADTQFWPFWVRTVPNNTNKISIEFKLENDKE